MGAGTTVFVMEPFDSASIGSLEPPTTLGPIMNSTSPVLAGLLSASLVLGPALSAPLPKPIAESRQIRLRYAITLIGLPIGTASVSGSLGPSGYRLEANGKLTGLAGVIVNSKGAATATGSLGGGHVNPSTFAATAATGEYLLTIRMAMAGGTAEKVEIAPVFEQKPDRVPLSDADRRGIVDPMSSFFMAVPGNQDLIGPAACNRTLPMFDGGVRFDITLAYLGVRQVKGAGYAGPVAVCSARYKPIAGHRPDRPATKFMTNNKEMEVWLAPVAGTRFVVPYRISVLSMIGTTVIEATAFDIATEKKAAAAHP